MSPNIKKLVKKLLKSKSMEERHAAAKALGETGDPKAVEPLIEALRVIGLSWYDHEVTNALIKIGDTNILIKVLLTDRDIQMRGRAASILGRIGKTSSVDALVNALNRDTDASVRFTAAFALGNIADPRALNPLIQALRDGAAVVRKTVVMALKNFNDPRALEAINTALNDGDEKVRIEADQALKDLKQNPIELERTAQSYENSGQLSLALQYYNKAFSITQKKTDKARIYNNIGLIYKKENKMEEAIEYIENAININEEMKNVEGQALCLYNLGIVHLDMGNDDVGTQKFLNALRILKSNNLKDSDLYNMISKKVPFDVLRNNGF